jgi:hypothetical protein
MGKVNEDRFDVPTFFSNLVGYLWQGPLILIHENKVCTAFSKDFGTCLANTLSCPCNQCRSTDKVHQTLLEKNLWHYGIRSCFPLSMK